MSLGNLIQQHALADAQAGNWNSVAATLNTKSVKVRNPKSWTMADLVTLLGAEHAALVGGTIQAAGASNPLFAGAWIALNVTGLQLHTDDRQAMIQGLAVTGGWPAELTAAALHAGVQMQSIAEQADFADVTAEQCQAVWELAKTDAALVAAKNEIVNAAEADPARTKASIAAAYRQAADLVESV